MTDTVAAWDGLFWTGAEPPYIPGILTTVDASLTRVTLNMTLGSDSGTLYWAVTPSSYAGEPTIAQIKSGAGATGSGSAPVTAKGQFQLLTPQILTPSNEYKVFAYHEDAKGRAGSLVPASGQYVQSSAVFNTDPPVTEVDPDAVSMRLRFDPPIAVQDFTSLDKSIFEGDDSFKESTNGGKGKVSIVNTRFYSGTQSFEAVIDGAFPTHYRAEINPSGFPWKNAAYAPFETWIGFAMYVDPAYYLSASPKYSGSMFQVHSGENSLNGVSIATNPVLALRFESDGRLHAQRRMYDGTIEMPGGPTKYYPGVDFNSLKGKWISVVVNFKYAKDATGHIRIYVNPTISSDIIEPGIVWENCVTWDPLYTILGYWKAGIYLGSSGAGNVPNGQKRRINYDDFRAASAQLGGNYATVNPGSYV